MIPLVDLQSQHKTIQPEIDAAIGGVLADCGFVKGPRVAKFENSFARYCRCSEAVGTSSGTAALHLALEALGIGAGDEVIVPSHTFIATVEPISRLGARIVFADVDSETYTIDPASVNRCITSRTRAIVPVHLYGQMADMGGIGGRAEGTQARRHGGTEGRDGAICIVEDAAQAHGARQGSCLAGSIGDVGCFSFYPGKNLGAYGDAGAVVTSDNTLARRMRQLGDHGRSDKYKHETMGYNYRLDALQAAVLQVKLAHLDEWNSRRRSRAALYDDLLGEVPGVTIPAVAAGNEHVYHLYVIQVDHRDGLRQFLADRQIATGVHYPIPLHRQPALQRIDHRSDALPVTERLVGRILSLPMFPELTDDQVAEVADAVREFQLHHSSRLTATAS